MVEAQGSTVGEALHDLERQYPELAPYLIRPEGKMLSFVHIFLGGEDVISRQALDTPLSDGAELHLVPSIASQ